MGFNALQSIYRVIAGSGQNITTSGTAANNATPFGAQTRIIRIACTQAVRYRVDTNAVAVATDTLLPAGAVEYVRISNGQSLSVIQDTTAGVVNVSECTL